MKVVEKTYFSVYVFRHGSWIYYSADEYDTAEAARESGSKHSEQFQIRKFHKIVILEEQLVEMVG